MCAIDDGEPASVYRQSRHTSRKEYKCDECFRAIGVGEKYVRTFMVYEGHGSTFFTCEHCDVAASWLVAQCGGYLSGGVWEDFCNHVDEYPSLAPHLQPLIDGLRVKWRDGDGLMPIPAMPPTITEKHL